MSVVWLRAGINMGQTAIDLDKVGSNGSKVEELVRIGIIGLLVSRGRGRGRRSGVAHQPRNVGGIRWLQVGKVARITRGGHLW